VTVLLCFAEFVSSQIVQHGVPAQFELKIARMTGREKSSSLEVEQLEPYA
jgi:hypothetical protein